MSQNSGQAVCSCILGLGGVRVGTSNLLQGISSKRSKTHTHLTEKQRKKIAVLPIRLSENKGRIWQKFADMLFV